MSISQNIKSLSNKQKSDLQLAQTLLDNLNSIRPAHINKTSLIYDGKRFEIDKTGFSHKFLLDDIHLSIKDSLEEHSNFILDRFQKEFKNYDSQPKTEGKTKNLITLITAFIAYYKSHPFYSNKADFKEFIDKLSESALKELPEI